MTLIISLVVLAVIAVWAISIYNQLIKNRNLVQEGWSGIDVQLIRRANLIPNILECVKGYMKHEKSTLENITHLRSQCLSDKKIEDRAQHENMLTAAFGKLFALAENYPDLKANQNFMELQKTLENIENEIQMSRRYYNGTVRDYNIVVESFPSNLVAKMFSFIKSEFFEIEDQSQRNVPTVSFN